MTLFRTEFNHLKGFLILAIGLTAGSINIVQASPFFQPLGRLAGDSESFATAISRDGRVVVGYSGQPLPPARTEAFIWTGESGLVGLGGLPGWDSATPNSRATDVSADGRVVVGSSASTLRPQGEAFRWSQTDGVQSIVQHSLISLITSSASAISNDGSIIYGNGQDSNGGLRSFRTVSGEFQQHPRPLASAISADGTVIAGNRLDIPGSGRSMAQRYGWNAESPLPLGDLPGGIEDSAAMDISADGSVIVGFGTTSFGREPFVWTQADGLRSLGALPTVFSLGAQANAVSADGTVIVGEGIGGVGGAFIWTEETGYRLLMDVLRAVPGVDLHDWQALLSAEDVSADGLTIVGHGVNSAGRFEAFVARVPCPHSGLLFLAGVIAVVVTPCRFGTASWNGPVTRAYSVHS